MLEAAAALFYAEGINIGVDAIAKKAETTKMALYRHFESKDALIAAWITQLVIIYSEVLDNLEIAFPNDYLGQLRGFAQFIADDISSASHRGCPFINTIAELPDASHPARQLIEKHKKNQLRRLCQKFNKAKIKEPDTAAVHFTGVLEGAQVMAQNHSVENVNKYLWKIIDGMLG